MKKLLMVSLMVAGLAAVSSAQVKPVQKATIKTPNALCEACKTRIESYLRRYDGITVVDVNYRKGETKVTWLSDRIDIEQIKTAISNLGYDADDVPANEDSYKRLPKTCKKFEDGGGHTKPKTPQQPAQ
jgi:mercuric ion binding protein